MGAGRRVLGGKSGDWGMRAAWHWWQRATVQVVSSSEAAGWNGSPSSSIQAITRLPCAFPVGARSTSFPTFWWVGCTPCLRAPACRRVDVLFSYFEACCHPWMSCLTLKSVCFGSGGDIAYPLWRPPRLCSPPPVPHHGHAEKTGAVSACTIIGSCQYIVLATPMTIECFHAATKEQKAGHHDHDVIYHRSTRCAFMMKTVRRWIQKAVHRLALG